MRSGTLAPPPAPAPAIVPPPRDLSLDLRLLAADLGQVVRDLDDGHLAAVAERLERHRDLLTGLASKVVPADEGDSST